MKYADLPAYPIHIRPAPAYAWTCLNCHWQNPGICKFCGNCNRPLKKTPCITPESSQAHAKATIAEKSSQNAGLIYIQAELLTAAHRCAEAMEQSNRTLTSLCELAKSWLTKTK